MKMINAPTETSSKQLNPQHYQKARNIMDVERPIQELIAVGADEAPLVLNADGVAHYVWLRERYCKRSI